MTRAYMLRVEVGAHYTDGRNLWTVTGTNQLGSVDLENAASGAPRTMGIDAFRRVMWLAAVPSDPKASW